VFVGVHLRLLECYGKILCIAPVCLMIGGRLLVLMLMIWSGCLHAALLLIG